jgi:secreted Zn-dependent insulinase-like peptidase
MIQTMSRCFFVFTETTIEKLQAFIPRLFSQAFIEMFVYGNVTRQVIIASLSFGNLLFLSQFCVLLAFP